MKNTLNIFGTLILYRNTEMVIKLNKGLKKDLAIVIGNQFSSVKLIKINTLKSQVKTFLEPLKTLNKKNTKLLQKLVPKEFESRVETAVNEFKVVQGLKPKRPLSQYMNFSARKSKETEFTKLSFSERGKEIAKIWNKLELKDKTKFNLSKKEYGKYDQSMSTYQSALKTLKTNKH